jgi:plasmid maintenance system antidote protein VapI
MGFILSIGAGIWGIISGIAAAVTSLIATIGAMLITIVSGAYTITTTLVAYIGTSLTSLITGNWKALASEFTKLGSTLAAIGTEMYVNLSLYLGSIYSLWKTFAGLIHLDVLIKLNTIGMIISKDYRMMMNKFWQSVADVSHAMGLGTHTLTLLFRNARAIVLDSSTMLGKPYDLAEVEWLNRVTDFMTRFEQRAEHYAGRPDDLIVDIDAIILPDAVNAKSKAMQSLFLTIDKTIDSISGVAGGIDKVNDDIKNLVAGLPENIRSKIEHYTKPITDKVDNFIDTQYLPRVNEIQQIVNVLSNTQSDYKDKFDGLVNRIKKPAHYLREIDSMSLPERTEQEEIICEISGRSSSKVEAVIYSQLSEIETHIKEVVELQEDPETPNKWYVKEDNETSPLPQSEQGKENTWFVGDY